MRQPSSAKTEDPLPVEHVGEAAVPAGTGTLGKAIALVDLIAGADQPLRFAELLRLTDQPRGSLHRQLRHLVAEGVLDVTPDGAYEPGIRLLTFAARAWSRNTVRHLAEPHLRRLQEETGETIHFGVLRGLEIVYLDKLESRQAVRMHSQVGIASPVYCTGIGKASLSCLNPDARASLLNRLVFQSHTAQTIVDPERLTAEVEESIGRGYAFDWEEHQPGIRCVAAPIRIDAQEFVGGVSVTAPAFRADRERLETWSVPLRQAALDIARDVGNGLGPRR